MFLDLVVCVMHLLPVWNPFLVICSWLADGFLSRDVFPGGHIETPASDAQGTTKRSHCGCGSPAANRHGFTWSGCDLFSTHLGWFTAPIYLWCLFGCFIIMMQSTNQTWCSQFVWSLLFVGIQEFFLGHPSKIVPTLGETGSDALSLSFGERTFVLFPEFKAPSLKR